ncbi:hypothetical protein [Streptomyces sp. NPDC058304]|uniref:hypothetical protein n=1 Tax=Streptomyces sp. NPDC058304 TaxID=3346437 RepID=UPI0036E1E248
MVGTVDAEVWATELEAVFGRAAGRFGRVDLRWRMRDCIRGLLAPVAGKNSWQLAEWAGHRADVLPEEMTREQMRELAARYNGGPCYQGDGAQAYGRLFDASLDDAGRALR